MLHVRGDSNRLPPVQRARMSIESPPRKELVNSTSPCGPTPSALVGGLNRCRCYTRVVSRTRWSEAEHRREICERWRVPGRREMSSGN